MKLWILATSFSLILAGWGLAQHQSEKLPVPNEEHFYYLPQLSQEEIQQFLDSPSSSILVCPEGTLLSLDLFLRGDLVELQSNSDPKSILKIKQTFYLRCQQDQILISLDGINWKTWSDILTGTISLTIGVDETGPALKINAETYLRSCQESS